MQLLLFDLNKLGGENISPPRTTDGAARRRREQPPLSTIRTDRFYLHQCVHRLGTRRRKRTVRRVDHATNHNQPQPVLRGRDAGNHAATSPNRRRATSPAATKSCCAATTTAIIAAKPSATTTPSRHTVVLRRRDAGNPRATTPVSVPASNCPRPNPPTTMGGEGERGGGGTLGCYSASDISPSRRSGYSLSRTAGEGAGVREYIKMCPDGPDIPTGAVS